MLKNDVLKKCTWLGIDLERRMSLSGAKKLEGIKRVEGSELPVQRTLAELGVSRSSFYRWYRQYLDDGSEGWQPTHRAPRRFCNPLPER